MRILNYCVV